jgi:hypothetical protein
MPTRRTVCLGEAEPEGLAKVGLQAARLAALCQNDNKALQALKLTSDLQRKCLAVKTEWEFK